MRKVYIVILIAAIFLSSYVDVLLIFTMLLYLNGLLNPDRYWRFIVLVLVTSIIFLNPAGLHAFLLSGLVAAMIALDKIFGRNILSKGILVFLLVTLYKAGEYILWNLYINGRLLVPNVGNLGRQTFIDIAIIGILFIITFYYFRTTTKKLY